jgi:hypothetical protein
VIEDYFTHDGWRVAAKTGLYLTYFLLLAMGAYVIVAFDSEFWMAQEGVTRLLTTIGA